MLHKPKHITKYLNNLKRMRKTIKNFFFFLNAYFVECDDNIKFDKNFDLTKTIKNFGNQKQKIAVFDNNSIEAFIIYAKSKIFIKFFDKQNKDSNFKTVNSNKFFIKILV